MAKIQSKGRLIAYGYICAVLMHFSWNALVSVHWVSYFVLVPLFMLILKLIADVAWRYELEAYLSPRDELEARARQTIFERDGASTLTLADELKLDPHRTALFMKEIGARFDRGKKKWYLIAELSEKRLTPVQD